jgi:hypothetical protein
VLRLHGRDWFAPADEPARTSHATTRPRTSTLVSPTRLADPAQGGITRDVFALLKELRALKAFPPADARPLFAYDTLREAPIAYPLVTTARRAGEGRLRKRWCCQENSSGFIAAGLRPLTKLLRIVRVVPVHEAVLALAGSGGHERFPAVRTGRRGAGGDRPT